jgi:hypothetical protein
LYFYYNLYICRPEAARTTPAGAAVAGNNGDDGDDGEEEDGKGVVLMIFDPYTIIKYFYLNNLS